MPIFYGPVGALEERKPGIIYLPGWINASPFAELYFKDTPQEAYHTGLDLNRNIPTWDLDAHSPVWSISGTLENPGKVLYAQYHSPGWGNLVIAEYPDGPGKFVYARFAHLENVRVKVGDLLYWDTQIAQVGRINDKAPYHCHYDLADDTIKRNPGDWPKLRLDYLLAHYYDPAKFTADHASEPVDPELLHVQPAEGVRLRSQPSLSARIVRLVPQHETVRAFDAHQVGDILWRRVETTRDAGWMAQRQRDAAYLVSASILYIQPREGLRLRDKPGGKILRVAPQNEQIQGFDSWNEAGIAWRHVHTVTGAGWMGQQKGPDIYLSATPAAPPVEPGDTPYDGKTLLWGWDGRYIPSDYRSIDKLASWIKRVAPGVNAIAMKVANGVNWQGDFDTTAMEISGPASIATWLNTLARYGIEFHAWMVVRGLDIPGEAQRMIDTAKVAGVRSLILDVEPYLNFLENRTDAIQPIMARVRAAIPATFHIAISVDPRPQHYASVTPANWAPFVDSVLPQIYWQTFQQTPARAIADAYSTWSRFGKPVIPALQGDAPVSEIKAAIADVKARGAKGATWWRIGVIGDAAYAAIGGAAPLPPPVPPPPPARHETSVIGLHISPFENPADMPQVLGYLDAMHRLGREPAGVLLYDPGFWHSLTVHDIRSLSPRTEIILRRDAGIDYARDWRGATRADGKAFFNEVYPAWIANYTGGAPDFWQLWNEPKPNDFGGFNAWLNGILDGANERKIKLVLPMFPVGVPVIPDYDPSPWYWDRADTIALLERIGEEGHRLALHQYQQSGGMIWNSQAEVFRHELIYARFPAHLKNLPLAITEYGSKDTEARGLPTFAQNVALTIDRLSGTMVKYVCLWGVGYAGQQWKPDRIDPFLSWLQSYLAMR